MTEKPMSFGAFKTMKELCDFYEEKYEDKSCENCVYHPDNIHEINDGLTKDEWHSAPCQFPDTKKRIFR